MYVDVLEIYATYLYLERIYYPHTVSSILYQYFEFHGINLYTF